MIRSDVLTSQSSPARVGVARDPDRFDVIICGGGLAGLTFARHLHRVMPHLRSLLIERTAPPLPESAFKVGESSIEIGAHYFADVLDLKQHLEHDQLEKLGLRYFYQSPSRRFVDRPEFGVARFLPAKSYQIDRGTFETHLREVVAGAGVPMAEGHAVENIELGADGALHTVSFRKPGGRLQRVRARWIVDASGRRRLIQRKLGLGVRGTWGCNASWFRIDGKLDVSSLVPRSETAWHNRVHESRWHSTNHMMGNGYWAWLIPLHPGNTSVGIVAINRLHDMAGYNTLERSLAWLAAHEPEMAAALRDYRVLDFLTLKNYAYTSRQAYSIDRWACVGEAAVFADPYYSVGSNMIAFGNELTCKMIALDEARALTPEFVQHANAFLLGLNDSLTDTIQSFYPYYGDGAIMSLKTIWDYYIGWTITDPRFYRRTFLDIEQTRTVAQLMSLAFSAHAQMLDVLRTWHARGSRLTFDFIDYMDDLPTLRRLFVRSLPRRTYTWDEALVEFRECVQRVEEAAHAIFTLAVEEVLPDHAAEIRRRGWVNVKALSLDPQRWKHDGLFEPTTTRRDFSMIEEELRRLYQRAAVAA